jgi:hypothetical protein
MLLQQGLYLNAMSYHPLPFDYEMAVNPMKVWL